ncbi:hypothetical protein BC938DRAFT_474704 [Jimgerdemannia flammicorona]|uniref:Uncharacterized protein n=1 Tax=Jimgerdemannia flammicorona TaxID=994334 RepID=A0A433Q228_9FUNG|nr:hypothetical protein BC938DRAFT_474704 [Jimgerdemannia flammicorona]
MGVRTLGAINDHTDSKNIGCSGSGNTFTIAYTNSSFRLHITITKHHALVAQYVHLHDGQLFQASLGGRMIGVLKLLHKFLKAGTVWLPPLTPHDHVARTENSSRVSSCTGSWLGGYTRLLTCRPTPCRNSSCDDIAASRWSCRALCVHSIHSRHPKDCAPRHSVVCMKKFSSLRANWFCLITASGPSPSAPRCSKS